MSIKRWVSAHAAAHYEAYPGFVPHTVNRTVRCELPIGITGSRVRIALTERMGTQPIIYGHIAVGAGGIVRDVLFGGSPCVTVPADGSEILSDPVELEVKAGQTLTLWMYNSGTVNSVTTTRLDSRHSAEGDMCGQDFEPQPFDSLDGSIGEPLCSYARIEVEADDEAAFAIAAFGDSITAMELWTPFLRTAIAQKRPDTSLVNLGIGGNRLLRDTNFPPQPGVQFFGWSGLRRLDCDCLAQSGLKGVILALGINDIGGPGDDPQWNPPLSEFPTFEQLKEGYETVVSRLHEHGLAVICATITPMHGTWTYRAEVEEMRCRVNEWIHTCGIFDMVIDFDAAVGQGRDKPLLPDCDSGDHLHPSIEGGRRMAEIVDVAALLKLCESK